MDSQKISNSGGNDRIAEISILWITAGLGCDGDTIAMTATSQPSIEYLLLSAIPWIPRVRLHKPFLSMEVEDAFLALFHKDAEGRWMNGLGGGPNVGGIRIGCTVPGFPDKFMPFMNQRLGSLPLSSAVQAYGRTIYALRRFTKASLNKPPALARTTEKYKPTATARPTRSSGTV